MILNFYDGMIESTLNWLKHLYLSPDLLNLPEQHKFFKAHKSLKLSLHLFYITRAVQIREAH